MIRPKIVSLGEVLWDLFPSGERFGGAPANFACHAAILGGEVSMVSSVGDDKRGHQAIEILQGFGIDVSLIQVDPDAPTGSVGVSLDANGKPTYAIHEGSAWDRIGYSADLEKRVADADAVYFGTLGQRSEVSRNTIRRALSVARQADLPRILDINLRAPFFDAALIRESIQHANILKLSDEELGETCAACEVRLSPQPENNLRSLLEQQNLDLVVMTRGPDGAMLASADGADGIVTQPGIPTVVKDTVGAGDSFTASFLLGRLRGDSHKQNLLNACTIAARVCSHAGAVPNEPANTPEIDSTHSGD